MKNDIFDYVIIGAGITGITLCKLLRECGYKVLVLEKETKIGGLCRTENINGHILDIGGGHFFNTKHKEVFDFVFKYLSKDNFNFFDPRISKILIGNDVIDYPIESNLWQLSKQKQIEFLVSTIRNGESQGKNQPNTYEEWIRWKLGDKICDEYMIPYNSKLWGVNPCEMDIDWLYKIPRVEVEQILQYCIDKKQDVNMYPAHTCFYYPKSGGFQSIIDAIAKDEIDNIIIDSKVISMEYTNEKIWKINNKYYSRNIVNTTPWSDLYDALGKPSKLSGDFKKIKYNRIVVSLYEKEYSNNWHWRYIPDPAVPHHREFYISNFALDSKKNGMYLETNYQKFNSNKNNFDGKLLCNYITDAAYPIPIIGHANAINNILNFYRSKNLFGVGRWGKHEYQNADVSIMDAINFVKNI